MAHLWILDPEYKVMGSMDGRELENLSLQSLFLF